MTKLTRGGTHRFAWGEPTRAAPHFTADAKQREKCYLTRGERRDKPPARLRLAPREFPLAVL